MTTGKRAMTWLASTALTALLAMPAAAETIKVGIILTYSGPEAEPSDQMDKGLALYVKTHEKDLPAGVTVELVRRDDTGPKPEVAKRLAQELVTRDHVQFITGIPWSNNAAAIAPVADEAKTPLVIMNAAASSLTRMSPYIARVSVTMWQLAYPLGKWTAGQGAKKAYIAVSDYAPGHDGEDAFVKAFTEAGGTIVGSVHLPLANPDFVPFLQRIKDAKPDVIFAFVPSGKQGTAFMKAYSDLGLKDAGVKLVSTQDLVADEELPNMGDAPLGLITSGTYSSVATRAPAKEFVAAYKQAYGDAAVTDNMAVQGWDGMAAIFSVIKATNGKFTGDQAMALLKEWKNPDSPRGPVLIDPATRDIVQNIYIRRTESQNGHLANVEFDTIPQVKDIWKELNPPK